MIGKVIKYKFDNTAALNSVFAGRVYPLIGAQAGPTPFCMYDVTSIRPEGSKDADSHIDVVNVELVLVGDNYGTLQTAVEDIRTAFVRMRETIEGVNVQSCGFDNQNEQYNPDEETYAISVDLVFRIVKS
jgi:hypothetical protein